MQPITAWLHAIRSKLKDKPLLTAHYMTDTLASIKKKKAISKKILNNLIKKKELFNKF